MSKKPNSDPSNIYQIRVRGNLDSQWSDWFDDLTIKPENDGTTLLTGRLPDQTALHGVLMRIRDLGLPLVRVIRVKGDDQARD